MENDSEDLLAKTGDGGQKCSLPETIATSPDSITPPELAIFIFLLLLAPPSLLLELLLPARRLVLARRVLVGLLVGVDSTPANAAADRGGRWQ